MSNTASKKYNEMITAGSDIYNIRNKFNRSYRRLDTFNYGELIPIYTDIAVPGDTFTIKQNSLLRLTTLTKPLIDNLQYQTYYFYIPFRLLCKNSLDAFKEMMGEKVKDFSENKDFQENTFFTKCEPTNITPTKKGTWKKGGLIEKLGAPIGTSAKINTMYIDAYKEIYNHFFRDENIQEPEITYNKAISNNKVDKNMIFFSEEENINDAKNARILHACKHKDYFTSAKQYTQQGSIASYQFLSQPVIKKATYQTTNMLEARQFQGEEEKQKYRIQGAYTNNEYQPITELRTYKTTTKPEGTEVNDDMVFQQKEIIDTSKPIEIELTSEDFNALDINDLRTSFALQYLKENNIRLGNRYEEKLINYWYQQIQNDIIIDPEYLGGTTADIAVQQVAQTSGTTETGTPQATLTAYSQTNSSDFITTKTIKEWGIIMGIGVLRLNEHTYSQGIEKLKVMDDYKSLIWKEFVNLGMQAVQNSEIYYNENNQSKNNLTFGFQEIYNEYRFKANEAHGDFQDTTSTNFNYALQDHYEDTPILNAEFLKEKPEQLDRVLVVDHTKLNQVTADFYFNVEVLRQLPTYSIPAKIV